ncbi:sensor histidine kinase [Cellulomonas fengjieae]|uniref:histidine kinase n=1 Tax=Cellulomonas fengjieae TaxID=2819978 RepID=A0ABS3SCQ2_9CELL|nr:HAMP domain-containing sensor histidine kinase [Cellulomonas fengjieae]MBO3083529.1 HAMP domain-containing histidine kinase [Cellulomonas fengjieae]MBO3101720.1 HAMP domain-containing histidine kinase [Cellulomonas fengjieae]QVI65152.1 HAMP domain-containing histidine kinase [Cellulomonas fengjieae]
MPRSPRTGARADLAGATTGSIPAYQRTLAHLTVRARLLTAVVVLSALTVLGAGGTAFALQSGQTDERIDNSLSRAVAALRTVQAGKDPATDRPFEDVNSVLFQGVRNRVPGENEGVVALLDGRATWSPAVETRAVRLEDDPELIALLAEVPADAPAVARTVTTSTTQYRLIAVPVQVSGDLRTGMFVVAFDRAAEMSSLRSTYYTYSAVGLGALAGIAIVAWFVVGRLLRPVRLLRDTTRRITESDLSERITVTGKDDLSNLARTVNAMLDRLERAFGSQRELLDDVGHELRTPLTIVRGHLELVDADDPDDVRATQALALDELDRMQRLVDDLMTLATAERPDFVRSAPTDVGRLTDDVHEKARGLGDRHWVVAARADVTVQLDAQRITQAWLQLLANACRYSAPRSTVRLGSEVSGDRLLLWVRDEGPGVPAEEAERIFERFHRGRADRVPHGAGLGLPIVAAIAHAHRGRVFVEHPPANVGPGVVFVLDLPAVDLMDGEPRPVTELVEYL